MDKGVKTIIIKHTPVTATNVDIRQAGMGAPTGPQQTTVIHPSIAATLNGRIGINPPKSMANVVMVDGVLKKIPRPRNAFMIFANEKRKMFQGMFPNDSNSQVSTRLGDAWRQLNPDVKQSYFDRAKREDLEHKRRFPNYHYAPGVTRKKRKHQATELKTSVLQPFFRNPGFGPPMANFYPTKQPTQIEQPGMPFQVQAGYAYQPNQFVNNMPINIHQNAFRGPPPKYPRASYEAMPPSQLPKIQRQEMGPGEQSTVTRVLKWVPIQVINTKEQDQGAPLNAKSSAMQFVTETSHAYVPVSEVQNNSVSSQPPSSQTVTPSVSGGQVLQVPSLPTIQTLMDTVSGPPMQALEGPHVQEERQQGVLTQADPSTCQSEEKQMSHNVQDNLTNVCLSNNGEEARYPAENPQCASFTSASETRVSTASTGECISTAMTTLLGEDAQGYVQHLNTGCNTAEQGQGQSNILHPNEEDTVQSQAVQPDNFNQYPHASTVDMTDTNRQTYQQQHPVQEPDAYSQNYAGHNQQAATGPPAWYGYGYQQPGYCPPSYHEQQNTYPCQGNMANDYSGCPPFMYMPCRTGYAASLGWDPNTLPHQSDLSKQTMCCGKVPCEPGQPCWLPPQCIPEVNKVQQTDKVARDTGFDNQAPAENGDACSASGGDAQCTEVSAPYVTARDPEELDIVHVITPDEAPTERSPPKESAAAENDLRELRECGIVGDRPSEDYSVAMSLAMLSTSGTNLS